jgi:hypothetical protein
MLKVEASNHFADTNGLRIGFAQLADPVEEELVQFDGQHRPLGVGDRRDIGRFVAQKCCSGTHRLMSCFVVGRGVAEPPTFHLALDIGLSLVVNIQTSCREYSTVIRAACAGPVLVDGARIIDEHRAVPVLVVPHQYVTSRQSWCREGQLARDVGQRVGFVRSDVDEL